MTHSTQIHLTAEPRMLTMSPLYLALYLEFHMRKNTNLQLSQVNISNQETQNQNHSHNWFWSFLFLCHSFQHPGYINICLQHNIYDIYIYIYNISKHCEKPFYLQHLLQQLARTIFLNKIISQISEIYLDVPTVRKQLDM